jgi:hypothetical protein
MVGRRNVEMPIAKREIVELLLARNDHQRAIRCDEHLPEVVHLEYHGRLLRDLGLDPAVLQWDLGQASRRFDRKRFSRQRPAARRGLAGRS